MELHEPTTDRGDQPAAVEHPKPERRTDGYIAPETEPRRVSDQVREPATSSIAEGVLVELGGREGSPTHPVTVDVMNKVDGSYLEDLLDIFEVNLIDWFGEVILRVPESPVPPESPMLSVSPAPSEFPIPPVSPKRPPNFPFPPSQTSSYSISPPLVSFIVSASPTSCTDLQANSYTLPRGSSSSNSSL